MNRQCKFCIHSDVCAYKEHYKDAVELYEKAKYECSKYPYFVCDIRCVKYLKKVEPQESEGDACKDCYYNDGEVHAECVICDKAESAPQESEDN